MSTENNPLTGIARQGRATVRRSLVDERSAILTIGDFAELIAAWRSHARIWTGDQDGLSDVLMRQGLAGAALHLVNRPRDETVAWTLNLKQPPTNVFVTGDARHGAVTGRVFVDGVQTAETSRLYVQTLRSRGEPTLSAVEVAGLDVLDIFEQYYDRSEQTPARFVEIGGPGDRFALVLGMPGSDREWVRNVDPSAIDALQTGARPLEEREVRFECGCSPRKMLRALRGIFADDPEDLFRGDATVETTCPRCGRRWHVTREQFEAAAER